MSERSKFWGPTWGDRIHPGSTQFAYGGDPASRTDFAFRAIRPVQESGGVAVVVSVGSDFDIDAARKLGINLDDLLVMQETSAECAMQSVSRIINAGGADLIIVNSVDQLSVPPSMEPLISSSSVCVIFVLSDLAKD